MIGLGLTSPLLGLEQAMVHTATIERDQATKDSFGARGSQDWQPIATDIPCFLWWGTGATITRAGSIHSSPQETVDLDLGGMIFPPDTDITAHDRIIDVQDETGRSVAAKLLILAVATFEPVTEVSIRRLS